MDRKVRITFRERRYLNGVVAPKLHFRQYLLVWSFGSKTAFLPIFSLSGALDIRRLEFKFSEMLNTAPISLLHWQKLLPYTFEWIYGSKTEFLPIFGPVVTSPLNL